MNCGSIYVEFFDNSGAPPDGINFVDDRTNDPINNFRTLYSDDTNKRGSYPFRYKVYHTSYPLNFVESPFPFTITIINPCLEPESLVGSTL